MENSLAVVVGLKTSCGNGSGSLPLAILFIILIVTGEGFKLKITEHLNSTLIESAGIRFIIINPISFHGSKFFKETESPQRWLTPTVRQVESAFKIALALTRSCRPERHC